MRASVSAARRQSTSRVIHTAYGTHSSGAKSANTSAVAFTLPTICTTMANAAGYRHPPLRSARTMSASNHPRPAHGSRITEMRAA